ncbi:EAL and GGDEF domain-containing protein [Pelosinus fermentans]|uniref:Diguanylate cyclase/phosphodiesterase with PAS/PAC sensor(S) n=1 Tax=Pelosinus fermentans JBW45 TaxID=1192197 RepID=I9NMU7_9FIRM|nr:bifunctional diguanylate cyclase/phosphodiesterase [Pelosinus fermentans]AJQ25800.1 diguanylate cyclase/phosphodiesterase with PAS/PAC sensor(s) [Pelosinus fermentans JBW45]
MKLESGMSIAQEIVALIYNISGYPVMIWDHKGGLLAESGALEFREMCKLSGDEHTRSLQMNTSCDYIEEFIFLEDNKNGKIVIGSTTDTAKVLIGLATELAVLLWQKNKAYQKLSHQMGEYETLFNLIPVQIWYKDTNNKIIRVNKQVEKDIGIPIQDFVGKSAQEFFPVYSKKYYEDDLAVLRSAEPKLGILEQINHANGENRWIYTSKIPTRNCDGIVTGLVALVVDITESKKMEKQMPIWAKIFESSGEAISVTDKENRFVAVNRAFSLATGYSSDEVIGREPSLLKSGCHDKIFYQNMWAAIIQTGSWEGEIWEKRKDGVIYLKWLRIDQIKDEEGNLINYLARFTDMSEKKAAEERIHYLARHDALTGLANREVLGKQLAKDIERARHSGSGVGVISLNLDRFKNINDSLGHKVGDEVLKELADRLETCSKRTSLTARFGGDTFNFIVPKISRKEEIIKVIHEVMSALERPLLHGGFELIITASIGVSVYPDDGDTAEVLIRNADTAMHKVKDNGRNFYEFFEANMNEYASERLMLENNLRRALAREEFVLFYQPQVDSKTEALIGVEALIRWMRPNTEIVPPGDFIPILEETGLIIPIGKWVLAEACRQHKEWIRNGLPPIPISVNISAIQFQEKEFLPMLSNIIKESGIEPGYLDLELTESVVMRQPEFVIKQLEFIKEMGINLSLDDFGTGFSSLSYLRYFPLDRLKIDQSFVRGLSTDLVNEAIIEAVVALGKSLKIKTIAEGVETKQELDFLRKLECDEIQGYYFSKPLPSDDFIKWFTNR